MTVINHTYGFIFVHIHKTGGTSVVAALSAVNTYRDLEVGGSKLGEAIQPYFRERFGFGKHATIMEIRKSLGSDPAAQYRSFSVLRDPVARAASTFAFLHNWTLWMEFPVFSGFVDEFLTCTSLDDFIASRFFSTAGPDRIFLPQAYWVCDPVTGSLAVNRLMNTVTLEEDLIRFLRDVGVPDELLGTMTVERTNVSGAGPTEINATSLRILKDRYARDWELLQIADQLTAMGAGTS